MKKIIKYLLILLVAIILPGKVFAKGSITANPTSITITKGTSANITIKANNAAGRLDISSSNTKIASVNTSSVWVDNQSQSIKISGKSVGSTTIVITKTDVATYDSEVLTGTIKINVKVVEKSSNTPKPTPVTPTETKKSDSYELALIGVKKVENSLLKTDYDTVKEMVNELKDEKEKNELLERLNNIEKNLKVSESKNEVVECEVCEKCEKTSNIKWIILSITLLLLLIAESVYIIFKQKSSEEYK